MNDYLVSIIIPCYNVEKYIYRCLESVVDQTYKNLEIILVDDGSTDNTPSMCDNWANRDDRIIVIHKDNDGVANARNDALNIAKGDYISFVDSDDYVEKCFIELLLKSAIDNNSDIVVCDYQINNEIINEQYRSKIVDYDYAISEIAKGTYKFGVLWNKLYKKNVVKDIRMPNYVCSEDLVFNYFVAKSCTSFSEVNSKLYHYMQNNDSTVHGKFVIGAYDAVKARKTILNDLEGSKYKDCAVFGYLSSIFVFVSGCVRNNVFKSIYDELRLDLKKYLGVIIKSDLFSMNIKIRTILLVFFPELYNRILISKKGMA